MDKLKFQTREIPVIREVEVLVAGGGYAGVAAAWSAARNGAKVLLVEQQSCLGGLVTMGYVALTFSYIEGLGFELFHALKACGAVNGRFLDLEKTKIILEQMLLKSGVELLYGTSVVDAWVENQTCCGAVIFNKGGLQAVRAERVIDASGDGDLAAAAGVPFEAGCPEFNNYNQATSLVMHVGNINAKLLSKCGVSTLWREKVATAVEAGEYPYLIDKRVNWLVKVPGRDEEHAEYYICYAHSRKCRCLDGFDLSRQLIEQRQQCMWTLQFMRKYLPGCADAWLIDSAPMLGVRESRRIMCEYKITGDDLVDGARFPDKVARAMHAFDAHHPTEVGHIKHLKRKNDAGEEQKVYVQPGQWREIPYRALVTLKIDNLLVAGRNVSADFMGQSGVRLVMECFNMGQAVGTAAALSLKLGVTPRRLPVEKLQQQLVEMGIDLFHAPSYGQGRIAPEIQLTPDDLIYPEQNRSGQATVVLSDQAAEKYGLNIVDLEAEQEQKYFAQKGYTDNGGDVGTNLE